MSGRRWSERRRSVVVGAFSAGAIALGATLAGARGGDDPTVASAEARAIVDAVMTTSATAPLVAPAIPDFNALPLIAEAGDGIDKCFARLKGARKFGDMRQNELYALRECVAQQLGALLEKMIALRSMQRSALFDYAVFTETVRLLTVAQRPAVEAISPFIAMLDAARRATPHRSEKIVIDALKPVAQRIETGFST